MSDLSEQITLGIGTPSTIKHFLTLGLGIAAVAATIGIVRMTSRKSSIAMHVDEQRMTARKNKPDMKASEQ